MTKNAMSNIRVLGLCIITFLASPAKIWAQAKTPREQAREHFNRGFAYYRAGQYLRAVKELKVAYQIRPVPLVLFYIGKTYQAAGLNEESITYFRKFLDEARLTDPNRKVALEAIRSMGGTAKAPPRVVEPTPPRPVKPRVVEPVRPRKKVQVKPGEIIHEVVEEARPNLPLLLEAELPEEIEWARLYVYFRKPGMDRFEKKLLKSGRRGIYSYLIHHSFLSGKSLQYYIEAVGRTGKRIAGSGTATSPNIVLLSNDAPLQPGARMDDSQEKGAGATPSREGQKGPEIPKGPVEEKKPWFLYSAVGLTVVTAVFLASGLALSISARYKAQDMADRGAPKLPDGWVYPPDQVYNAGTKKIQDQGKAYEIGSIVCYVLSAAAAGGATYLWLRHFKVIGKERASEPPPARKPVVMPMIDKDTVGVSYGISF